MSTPQVQYDIAEKGSDVDADDHFKPRVALSRTQKWYHWYNQDDTPEERRLVLKLDLLILIPTFLGYWIKVLDASAVSTAYVSGMKEDLSMYGNELTYSTSIYTAGYVAFQIPFTLLATVFPSNWWIPFCDLMWAVFTIAQYKVKDVHALYALRFFVGAFGSLYFPTVQYILGSWYRRTEITKRAAIFFVASQVGSMSSGYLQAAVYTTLDGRHGLAGWRWLMLIDGIVTIPVALISFVLLPGVPEKCTSRWLSPREKELAQKRVVDDNREPLGKLSYQTFVGLFSTWHWWALVALAIFFSNADGIMSNSGLSLWLKATGYNVVEINTISTVTPVVTILFAVVIAVISDARSNTESTLIIIIAIINIFCGIVLAIWYGVPLGLKFFAFFLSGSADGVAAVVYSWANIICASLDGQQRALVLSSMNSIGNAFAVWLPLLVWQTMDAPRYLKGYTFAVADDVAMIVLTMVVRTLWKREQGKGSQDD
ncbi:MFS general substrate transporter [Armillaria solidipes]|uniref:MFS general substrate transporter n=1 Tax=Armillaria solidipes TaxID=1076256 RepID=A0A2H3AZ15_9AGAR|nr:MFS general substrate transporter [Armillaria solidipes]